MTRLTSRGGPVHREIARHAGYDQMYDQSAVAKARAFPPNLVPLTILSALTLGIAVFNEPAAAEGAEYRSSVAPQLEDTVVRSHPLAVGGTHACAITAERIICWGDDRFGQLGDGVALGRERWALVATDVTLRNLAAGWAHTCGLDDRGLAYCWGANARGELGDGTFVDRAAPVPVADGRQFVDLSAGPGLSCGLTTSGAAYCWGIGRPTPKAISSPLMLRALASTYCGLAVDDTAYCWFYNWSSEASWDETGPARATQRFTAVAEGYGLPRDEDPDWTFRDPNVAELGGHPACGVTPRDRVLCWTARETFSFGRIPSVDLEVEDVGIASARTIVVGARHACGLAADGTVYCWHWDHRVEGGEVERSDQAAVETALRFRTIAAYGDRTCGMAQPNDGLFCWDRNDDIPTPVVLSDHQRIRMLATGLPLAEPRDTSDHWRFTLPAELGLRFRGPASCQEDAPLVSEGPEHGRMVGVRFTSGRTGADELWDEIGVSLEELGYHAEAAAAYYRYLALKPDGAAAERVREILRRR